jgi:integrase
VETLAEWSDRWLAVRADRGLATVDDDRSRLRNHVLPLLGAKNVRTITRDNVEELVEKLDAGIRAHVLSWKTASHAWGLVTRMFADACGAKRRDLRVREDNPAHGVHGPDRGVARTKVYLYPAEFFALIGCERVPLRWRRTFAITTFLYARAGEVNALTWADCDLERGVVHIHASANRKTGDVSTTKSGKSRRVPIERELLPLLLVMHEEEKGRSGEAVGAARVSPVGATDRKLSRQLRRCLRLAGVARADLFADDENRKPITFHDLRSSGITWCAVRGGPAAHQAARGTRQLQHDGGLHPGGGEPPRSQLRRALPPPTRGAPHGSGAADRDFGSLSARSRNPCGKSAI